MTMKTILLSGVLIAAAPAFACDYPKQPGIPDGATASKEEMITASKDVKAYLAEVDNFLNCIEDEEKAAIALMGDDATDDEIKRRSDMLDKRFEAANEEKALLGEKFNQQVRAYNTKAKAAKN